MIFPGAGVTVRSLVLPWTPAVSASSGSFTTTTVNYNKAYQLGNFVFAEIDVTLTTLGTASGALFISLPKSCKSWAVFNGHLVAATVIAIHGDVSTGGNTLNIGFYNAVSVITAGNRICINGWFEALS